MGAVNEDQIAIREIDAIGEIRSVERLQKEIWGIPDIEVVPLTQLVAAKASGGVLIGAFDGKDLVGFAYGFAGFERGVTVHHSHMLAVRPEYRSHDLGFRLKKEQRARVIAQGINVMTWTFDPLQSLNAYFNINKLGAVSDRYLVNFYGADAASFLHQTGTDRVIERLNRGVSDGPSTDLPRLVALDRGNRPACIDPDAASSGGNFSIEIPADINALEKQNSKLASEWREVTRVAFTKAIDAGFIVKEFHRGTRDGQPFGSYVLMKGQIDFK